MTVSGVVPMVKKPVPTIKGHLAGGGGGGGGGGGTIGVKSILNVLETPSHVVNGGLQSLLKSYSNASLK